MAQKNWSGKHSLTGHLKTIGIAVLFGLSAYGVIHAIMWLSQQAGGRF